MTYTPEWALDAYRRATTPSMQPDQFEEWRAEHEKQETKERVKRKYTRRLETPA